MATKNIVLKGLPGLQDELIIDELKTLGYTCLGISIIKKKADPMPRNPVMIIKFDNSTNFGNLRKIKTLYNTRIHWENYVNKKDTVQCHQCQRFGHGKNNCGLTPTCVKCGQEHCSCQKIQNAKTVKENIWLATQNALKHLNQKIPAKHNLKRLQQLVKRCPPWITKTSCNCPSHLFKKQLRIRTKSLTTQWRIYKNGLAFLKSLKT